MSSRHITLSEPLSRLVDTQVKTGRFKDASAAVNAAIARLESVFGRPHLHSGIGLRPFGKYFEFRAGLDL